LKEAGTWEGNIQNPEKVNKAEDLIYCIYTSGTTGTPKGVLVEHHGVVAINQYFKELYKITEKDVILQFANYIFDASVWEMTMALYNGATLLLIPSNKVRGVDEFEQYVSNKKATVALLPPQYFRQIKQNLFRVLTTGGSATSKELVEQIGDKERYINAYGPTENTVLATHWEKENDKEVPERIPIGKPISNTQIYILNGDNLCGIGVPGELCITGDGLARGYLNRPELTEEKFVNNPFGEGRLYRSGDLARWLPDGNIEYLGRIDEQVKVRGFRIELGEIESRIREIEGIQNSVVIAKADQNGDQALHAYYTGESISVSELREHLAGVLPEYMIPSYIMEIDSIPVTRNGKLDKKALPEIEVKATREYTAPSNETEETICKIFGEILAVENVGVKDSFFELGGHSLRATRLVNKIESETGYRIAIKDVFSHPTPEKLSQIVLESETEEYIPIPRAEEKEYYAMSSAQKRTYLIQQMYPEGTMYNMRQALKLTGEVSVEDLRRALQEIVERHEILRTEFLMVNGETVQKVLETAEVPFEYEEASNRTDEEEMKLFVRAFDLSKAPPIRALFVKRDTYGLLMLNMHHIVGDGMSMATFMNELNALYKGEKLE
ncbi:non-ribosomal peptide synthetase, partial [Lysinibacillus sphaericus]